MNAVDTNILIYACDRRDATKQARALGLLERLTDGVLLWQVACEFVAASRKLEAQGFTASGAWARLEEFAAILPLISPSATIWPNARKLHVERGVSFWDAMLLAACREAGVERLYSEDLPGGVIEGLAVVNPFTSP